jgi:hypothetical protein
MNNNDKKIIVFVLIFLLFVPLVVLGPIFTIWSIQILFKSSELKVNFESWCAAAWLTALIHGIRLGSKSQ